MNILITGAWQGAKEHFGAIEAMGHRVLFQQFEKDSLPCDPAWVEGVICNGLFLTHPIENFVNLRYIQLTSAGFDRVPMDYIQSHGITVHNAAGVYSVPMAEWTVMRLLELFKNTAVLTENQKNALWIKDRSWLELSGKTACIVGFGAYGMETAKRLKAFGMSILAVNRSKKESPYVDCWYSLEDLNEALPEADTVILAIALTSQTKNLFNAERFNCMKQGAVLLNAARGGLVDENALLYALDNGKLSGAALDVFSTEPLPEDSPIWKHKKTLLSPHNSFVGDHNLNRLSKIILDHLNV